jgi:prefoldin subunit 5
VAGITSQGRNSSKLILQVSSIHCMQSRLPVSKPLALVVIGFIIGVSLGLGSGYAVFYPDMVNERSKTVEDRIEDVEDGIASLDQRILDMNDSIALINENLEGVLALSEAINQINSRVAALENVQITLNSDLNDLEDQLADTGDYIVGLENDIASLEDSWEDVLEDFSDLETAYSSVNNELEDIQAMVRENDGVWILTAYMANPSSNFEQKISNEVYTLLVAEESDFADWVALYGENTAKILLQQEVDAMMGRLIWNPSENVEVGEDSYQVKLEAYFTFEFSPAKVTVDIMHMEIKATVDIDSGSISGLTVNLLEIL